MLFQIHLVLEDITLLYCLKSNDGDGSIEGTDLLVRLILDNRLLLELKGTNA